MAEIERDVLDESRSVASARRKCLTLGGRANSADLRAFLTGRMPRWQVPERWSFISEVPKTSVGKFAKTRIRESYARGDYEVIEAR